MRLASSALVAVIVAIVVGSQGLAQRPQINLTLSGGDAPRQPILADVMGDQRADLIVESTNDHLHLYESTPSGLKAPILLTVPAQAGQFRVADVDGDGQNDIVGANFFDVVLYLNSGTGFTMQLFPIGLLTRGPCFVVDLDGDGLKDIMRGFEWIRQTSPGVFAPAATIGLPGYVIPIDWSYDFQGDFVAGDVDGDGDVDIVNEHVPDLGNTATVRVFLNDGSGSFSAGSVFSYPRWSYHTPPGFADLDGDGCADLVVVEQFFNTASLTAYRGTVSGALIPWGTLGPGSRAREFLIADFNNDGTKELFWSARPSGAEYRNVMALSSSGSAFGTLVERPFGFTHASRISFGDFVGDGLSGMAYIPTNGNTPPGAPFPVVLRPHAAHVTTSMTGAVDVGNGDFPVDVLRLNGFAGGAYRSVSFDVGAPFSLEVQQPPSTQTPASFLVFGQIGAVSNQNSVTTAVGVHAVLPDLLTVDPTTFVLADGFGVSPSSLWPTTTAPWSVAVAAGLPFSATFSVQGVIEDATASSGYAVTNAIVVRVE